MATKIDKLVDIFLKIRWEKVQSTSSYVVLFGISLIGFNFWNWAWKVFFEPAGFIKDDNLPALIGVILIAFGLISLVADRFANRITPPTFEQDKRIYNQSMALCSWETVDWFLNDITAKYYRKGHKASLIDMLRFLTNEEHKFTNSKMISASEELIQTAQQLTSHLGVNFTGPNSPGSDIIEWNYDKNTQPGETDYQRVSERCRELEELSLKFEKSYKNYQEAANKLGLVTIR